MNEAQYCQVTGKKMYSRREAGEAINAGKRKYRGNRFEKKRAKITPKRCYKCDHCGKYHLTSSKNSYSA